MSLKLDPHTRYALDPSEGVPGWIEALEASLANSINARLSGIDDRLKEQDAKIVNLHSDVLYGFLEIKELFSQGALPSAVPAQSTDARGVEPQSPQTNQPDNLSQTKPQSPQTNQVDSQDDSFSDQIDKLTNPRRDESEVDAVSSPSAAAERKASRDEGAEEVGQHEPDRRNSEPDEDEESDDENVGEMASMEQPGQLRPELQGVLKMTSNLDPNKKLEFGEKKPSNNLQPKPKKKAAGLVIGRTSREDDDDDDDDDQNNKKKGPVFNLMTSRDSHNGNDSQTTSSCVGQSSSLAVPAFRAGAQVASPESSIDTSCIAPPPPNYNRNRRKSTWNKDHKEIQVKPCWLVHAEADVARGAATLMHQQTMQGLGRNSEFKPGRTQTQLDTCIKTDESCARPLVTNPNSNWRHLWDVIGAMLIGIDLLFIPLQFFNMHTPWIVAVPISCFWTIDFINNFFLGYYDKGILELRWKYIVIHYLRQWFIFDATIVTCDWITLLANVDSLGQIRIIRTLRFMRLLRLVKFKRAVDSIKDLVTSELQRTVLNVLFLLLMIVSINHIIACGWYGISTYCRDSGYASWLDADNFQDISREYAYATSLHWSLTQFTPASMEVTPKNEIERLYSVLVLLFALVVFSSFLSSLTATLTRFQALRSDSEKQFMKLRTFLSEKQVSHRLAMRVQRYIRHVTSEREKEMHMADVKLLSVLSAPLQMDLEKEIYSPILSYHIFFAYYCEVDESAIRKLCHSGISRIDLSEGDTLFSTAEPAHAMYFVLKGKLTYMPGKHLSDTGDALASAEQNESGPSLLPKLSGKKGSTKNGNDGEIVTLSKGHFACEACLWVEGWHHQGVMFAKDDANILVLNAEVFTKVTSSHGKIAPHACKYAAEFLTKMKQQLAGAGEDPDKAGLDVAFCNDDLFDVVCEAFPHFEEPKGKDSYAMGLFSKGRRKTPVFGQKARASTVAFRKSGIGPRGSVNPGNPRASGMGHDRRSIKARVTEIGIMINNHLPGIFRPSITSQGGGPEDSHMTGSSAISDMGSRREMEMSTTFSNQYGAQGSVFSDMQSITAVPSGTQMSAMPSGNNLMKPQLSGRESSGRKFEPHLSGGHSSGHLQSPSPRYSIMSASKEPDLDCVIEEKTSHDLLASQDSAELPNRPQFDAATTVS